MMNDVISSSSSRAVELGYRFLKFDIDLAVTRVTSKSAPVPDYTTVLVFTLHRWYQAGQTLVSVPALDHPVVFVARFSNLAPHLPFTVTFLSWNFFTGMSPFHGSCLGFHTL